MQNYIKIIHSQPHDLETIFEFYGLAVAHQKKVGSKYWQGFSRDLIMQEIEEGRQYKILVNEQVAALFVITFNDPQIWEERDLQPSIYIHRIVTHPGFRGHGFVKHIIDWAKGYAKNNKRHFIRIDTWADNEKLFAYYTSCGFEYAGSIKVPANSGLPKHYEGITLSLFEIEV